MKRRPPQWYQFGWWVVAGALVGLGIAFGLFCVVHFLLYGNFAFIRHMQALAGATDVKPADIFSMTATALGGFTIGGVAVMQYRKHKWAEYQAKMDEDSRTGERLGKAIEHLSEEQKLHTRLGAIYEFKNLAEDSERNRKNIIWILIEFIKSFLAREEQSLPQDVNAAANVLSTMVRKQIEELPKRANWGKRQRPTKCVYEATKVLSDLAIKNQFLWGWPRLEASQIDLFGMCLKGVDLYGANFKKTSLAFVNFEDAVLAGTNLKGTDFSCARFNENTSFTYGTGTTGRVVIDNNTYFDHGVRGKYFPDFDKG